MKPIISRVCVVGIWQTCLMVMFIEVEISSDAPMLMSSFDDPLYPGAENKVSMQPPENNAYPWSGAWKIWKLLKIYRIFETIHPSKAF